MASHPNMEKKVKLQADCPGQGLRLRASRDACGVLVGSEVLTEPLCSCLQVSGGVAAIMGLGVISVLPT